MKTDTSNKKCCTSRNVEYHIAEQNVCDAVLTLCVRWVILTSEH